jgi:hypothetical protein
VVGGSVTTVQVGEVNLTQIARNNHAMKKMGVAPDAPKTSNGNVAASKLSRAANKEVELSDEEKARMRRLAEQRSIAKMSAACKELLRDARKRIGSEARQMIRIRGCVEEMPATVPEEEAECQQVAE